MSLYACSDSEHTAFQNIMAVDPENMSTGFEFTKLEVSKIQNALKDETFVKLLSEYAKELTDPETRKRYEAEIRQLESDRGYHVSFVHPKPGYVLKVLELGSRKKIFINICSEEQVDKPVSQTGSQGGMTGLQWSIPYSLSKPREDIDRGGEMCLVYDVIFHPDTLYLAARDMRIKGLVHSTAFDAIDNCFGIKVDREHVKFPKLKFKGVFRPTVIRRPIDNRSVEPLTENLELNQQNINQSLTTTSSTPTLTVPKYSIRYRSETDLQDHAVYPSKIVSPTRPREMIVEIELPSLDSSASIDLDVQERSLVLSRDKEPVHKLQADLPYPVDEENGSAKFDKSRRVLIVTLPIKQNPVMIAERLSSNDSGIEVEDRARRSSVESMDSEEVSRDKPDCSIEDPNLINDYRTNNIDSFLKDSVKYTIPNYTTSVLSDIIIFTLEVKNVKESSVECRIVPGRPAVQLQFCTLGTGQFPIYFAFCVDFLDARAWTEADFEFECWDNNVVLQIPLHGDMVKYKVGLSACNLKEKEIDVERTDRSEINLKDEDMEVTKKNKYKQEKHPKMMKEKREEDEKGLDIQNKERHSSGESLDSSMSISPFDRINLEEMGRKGDVDESEQEEDVPRFHRAQSMEEPTARLRGILKRRKEVLLTGTRFRCYSESNVDEFGWNRSSRMGSAVSDTMIEEEDEEFATGSKKTVRFSEKVHQQLYRINSSIVAKTAKNKKKAEKKRRAIERRLSEGDSFELKKTENIKKSTSLDSEVWNLEDSHEDSGLASSFEESVVINPEQLKVKSKKKSKRRTKTFEMSNDLIFDLDI